MKLSDGEKLILVMLTELCQKLKVGNEDDAKLVQQAIYSGNLWGLEWAFPGIFHDSEPTEEMLHTTLDILDMWSFIERGHQALSPADKARVEKEAPPLGVKFRGFDGNGESAYISIARFLIEELDRFQEFEGRDLNSHVPYLGAYTRMLTVFPPLHTTLTGPSELNATQIITILKEAVHPESRKAAGTKA